MQQGAKISYFWQGWGVQHESASRAPKAPETEMSAENTSRESEIAFLPVLHTVVFLTKAGKGLFYVVSRREDWAFRVVHNEVEIFISHLKRVRNGLKHVRNGHLSPVLGEKWTFLTSFSFLTCPLSISHHFHKIRSKCEIFSPTFTREKGPISCLC